MENSIENTWKNAFANNELLAPKLVGLYEKKSEMIVDKMMRRLKIDNWSLIATAAVVIIIGFVYDYLLEGIYGAIVILSIFGLNSWMIKKADKIDLTNEPLVYLKSFMKWIKSTMKFYKVFLGIVLPIFLAPIFYFILSSLDPIQQLIQKNGLKPVIILIFFLCVFQSVILLLSYSISTKVIYGSLITKMKEIIKDLEELKS
ncbi:hypothetical protein OO013_05220 [Mangrovivirga sp. M17]|uniref:Uncharacterized protein n=1 Tax=Mangrovivirga halotolerans TaxID=2993936 RepID=A0ABT3RN99_9BACT|nr:hypothetical protein [Mangrovivirga halotolerans]MCX2743254.1 hypothetical protein [Mangrovivirga halotolerans]